jgi:hypothetical protein
LRTDLFADAGMRALDFAPLKNLTVQLHCSGVLWGNANLPDHERHALFPRLIDDRVSQVKPEV